MKDQYHKPQASYVSGTCDSPLLGKTIGEQLDDTVAQYPELPALISCHQSIRYNYRTLHEKVEQCARSLMYLGVQRGDRIGIWSPNNAQWCIIQLATAKIGAILVNINPFYRRHELAYVIRHSGLTALIMNDQFAVKNLDYIEIICDLLPELRTQDPAHFHSPEFPHLHSVICLNEDVATSAMISWQQLMQYHSQIPHEALLQRQQSLQFDDPINIQYTSGTTGMPKGATLSHHNILNNGYFVAEQLALKPGEAVALPVPLYHCFGMVMGNLGCITHGATMVYPSESFDPQTTLKAVEAEKAVALFGVPTMFIAELEEPSFDQYDLTSLRTGIMAGTTCPIEVMRQVIEKMHMRDITICYGMTETSPVSFQTLSDTPLEKRVSTVGVIHPHLEAKIIDTENGQILPRGQKGELCTRGYSVMLGYWNNAEATDEAITSGWMHTGDLAEMDQEGYVTITGRKKDIIIRGGENIYPREIEEFLHGHPEIMDAQVIGVPDRHYGEVVMAWVQCRPDSTLNEEALRQYCETGVAYYKVPAYFRFTDSFPMTITGKVQKFKMRDISVEELQLEAGSVA